MGNTHECRFQLPIFGKPLRTTVPFHLMTKTRMGPNNRGFLMWTSKDIVVTVASWENRFLSGFTRILENAEVEAAIVLFSDRYAEWTAKARTEVERLCEKRGVKSLSWGTLFDGSPIRTWDETFVPLFEAVPFGCSAGVDISTMPREAIWQTFWFLNYRSCDIGYVYHRPIKYGEWLSRDPERPRLVYKMSGLSRMGTRTALVILAGYDVDRVKHLTEVFEPAITLLGLQEDSVDPQNAGKMQAVRDAFKDDKSVTTFGINAYADDRGRAAIEQALLNVRDKYNVIMASMGPKMSAIALYELHRASEELGLVYLPSSEFNKDYSSGIGESIWGELRIDTKDVPTI
jgi:hypothetical protein